MRNCMAMKFGENLFGCLVGFGCSACAELYGDEARRKLVWLPSLALDVQPVRNCMAMKFVENLFACLVGFGCSACAEL